MEHGLGLHMCPVHLRSRGEHCLTSASARRLYGSPPLARRARKVVEDVLRGERFTSARAESTSSACPREV